MHGMKDLTLSYLHSVHFSCRHILHDPVVYPDPLRFLPERWLNDDGALDTDIPDPTIACFGFGRRY